MHKSKNMLQAQAHMTELKSKIKDSSTQLHVCYTFMHRSLHAVGSPELCAFPAADWRPTAVNTFHGTHCIQEKWPLSMSGATITAVAATRVRGSVNNTLWRLHETYTKTELGIS